jgi:thiosulfate/3-mercaptopyruvate sulfurtransferase
LGYKGYEDNSLVVSVEEASRLQSKRNVVFVDTRNYWKYVRGHIPGAFNLELYAFHWVDTSRRGINAFVKEMEMLFGSFGIDSQKEVIFYQNNSGYDAARGVWLLNYLGHTRVRLLDGGINMWRRKGFPLSTKDPPAPKPSKFVARPNPSMIATLDFLSSETRLGSAQVIDVRNPGEFSGEYRRALKGGHVPKAVNVEWTLALKKDGTLKSAPQLQKLYAGLSGKKDTVTYCQSGYRAAHSWLVLKLLGYQRVRNYLGSWYEYGNSPKTRVVR